MSWTVVIIIANVVVSYLGFQNPSLQYKLTMNPVAILRQGQWYRVITSGFIHSNWTHLAFNMFTFYFFGRLVEQIFAALKGSQGGIYFILFYILGIVISDLPSLLKHKNNPHYNSLGASGGVAAVVFCSILFFPTNPICLYGFICIPGFILGVIYLIYSYTKGKNMSDNVNHDAHLIGAVYGLVFSVIMEPRVLASFVQQISEWEVF
ncbi:rhomboid family intramembrane serine protease [Reichenbachiella carrageenanivorans]|uniref:Rhomboid family intramembrane serine protease n=1 Tax=Reichenbachiella carrageenanivorans TaxID=2979869 RepID=A0ABY6D2Q3_9BACT|nr:rhomboid family intramembrane serine protease [Reichenbachiella carrageenanivorans]UXX80446.1 rhomboid family intramembrane serine protease [Reichenbachiella carrageenanivorans]